MSRYILFLENAPVSWQTKKQPTVATSMTKAEYQALANIMKEVLWMRSLLKELGFPQINSPTIIKQDNQLSIALAYNPIYHGRTKHIDISHHFIRECVKNKGMGMPSWSSG